MKVVIFGASGATGLQLLKYAQQRNHQVTAFVRDAKKLESHPLTNIVEGDVSEQDKVTRAIRNQDAVLCALGAATPFKRNMALIRGVENIVHAMKICNVDRIVYQSYLGLPRFRKELGFIVDRILPIVLTNVIADHEEKERHLVESGLRWTIVRCAMLTNGRNDNVFQDGERIIPEAIFPTISRSRVASFMLDQLTTDKYIHKKPRIFTK